MYLKGTRVNESINNLEGTCIDYLIVNTSINLNNSKFNGRANPLRLHVHQPVSKRS